MSEINLNPDHSIKQPEQIQGSTAPDDLPRETEKLRERLFSKLAEVGVTKVTVAFSGWIDSGLIKHMLTERSVVNSGVSLDDAVFDGTSLYFALRDWVLSRLDSMHEGWRKGDGSFGTYTLDVERREVHENFVVRETDVRDDVPKDDEDRSEQLQESLFARLAELGVASVEVECEGGGDQGEVVSAEPTMEPGRTAPFFEETEFEGKPIWDAIEEVVLADLSSDSPGWELDWGSDATYVLDVPTREVACVSFLQLEEPEDEAAEVDDEDEGDEE